MPPGSCAHNPRRKLLRQERTDDKPEPSRAARLQSKPVLVVTGALGEVANGVGGCPAEALHARLPLPREAREPACRPHREERLRCEIEGGTCGLKPRALVSRLELFEVARD